jgi:hypothetical protein
MTKKMLIAPFLPMGKMGKEKRTVNRHEPHGRAEGVTYREREPLAESRFNAVKKDDQGQEWRDMKFSCLSSSVPVQLTNWQHRPPDQSDSNLFLFKNGLDYSSKPTAAEISIIIWLRPLLKINKIGQ